MLDRNRFKSKLLISAISCFAGLLLFSNSANALFGLGCDKPKAGYAKLIKEGKSAIDLERKWCKGKTSNTPGVDWSRLLDCAKMNPSDTGNSRYNYPTQEFNLAYQVVLNNSKCFSPELVARIQLYVKARFGAQPWI